MEPIEQALLDFFILAARKDETLLLQLRKTHTFTIDETRWCFTLPDLYGFIKSYNTVFSTIDYKQFRQLLYNSPVNEFLKQHDAEIIITDNRGNVNESGYALSWNDNS